MATFPEQPPLFDLREQIARIDKMQAELQKLNAETLHLKAGTSKVLQETRFGPFTLLITGLGAGAALIAAGAALAKLLMI
ncbi:hypothetical protein [Sphingomonas bacterium]|uniref:hypothetical protein n=1 Tax=Sphingomonas bacterium TaxID=1895847 RepID=UPI00157554B7|nr:hypothetical protein [Sphingomonas bacterium]